MATEANIIIDEPTTVDRRLDASQVTQGVSALNVVREHVVLTGAEVFAEIARVLNGNPSGSEYALVVRTMQGHGAGTPLFVDPIDRALRDLGKVDIAAFDAALPAGANNIGDVDVLTVPAPLSTTGGGTEAAALRVTVASDSTGVLSVDDNSGSLTVDNG